MTGNRVLAAAPLAKTSDARFRPSGRFHAGYAGQNAQTHLGEIRQGESADRARDVAIVFGAGGVTVICKIGQGADPPESSTIVIKRAISVTSAFSHLRAVRPSVR